MRKLTIPLEPPVNLTPMEKAGWLWSQFPIAQPITIVTTVSKEGKFNAAIKSWVTPVCSSPWFFTVSSSKASKTTSNILETKEFVINIPRKEHIQKVLVTSEPYSLGVNKLEKAGFSEIPSEKVKPPRIKECRAHLECKLAWHRNVGNFVLLVGEVVAASVDEDLYRIDMAEKQTLLGQMLYFGTKAYGLVGEVKSFPS